jgi:hypothetical protein
LYAHHQKDLFLKPASDLNISSAAVCLGIIKSFVCFRLPHFCSFLSIHIEAHQKAAHIPVSFKLAALPVSIYELSCVEAAHSKAHAITFLATQAHLIGHNQGIKAIEASALPHTSQAQKLHSLLALALSKTI